MGSTSKANGGISFHDIFNYCRWDTLDVMPWLCATARITNSDGPSIEAFHKIEHVGGGISLWWKHDIHPNQKANSKNMTSQIYIR